MSGASFRHMRATRFGRYFDERMETTMNYPRTILLLSLFVIAAPLLADTRGDFFGAIETGDVARVKSMLADDPTLAGATNGRGYSAVMAALFRNSRGFFAPRRNEVLQAVLAARPELTFFEACGVGDRARVGAALAADRTLATAWHPVGWTGLHLAAFSGDAETVKVLLAAGADVNARARNKFKVLPLQAALLTGQYDTAKVLIESGADVLTRQAGGFAPMHEAAFLGRRDLVDLLLANGAELGARANDGRTPLTEALRGKHRELAEYLRSKGAPAGEITADLTARPE